MATGYKWTIEKMVTETRATTVARELFPDEYHEGDCMMEMGREGLPCRYCAADNKAWQDRVNQVREAMIKAFSHT